MNGLPSLRVTEPEFAKRMACLRDMTLRFRPDFVTGPGRSGAMAAVYASYALGIPFVAWMQRAAIGRRVLIIDTASMSGRTMRRARTRYESLGYQVECVIAFSERERRHRFWYEGVAAESLKNKCGGLTSQPQNL